jgi:hypothetical protein
MALAPIPFRAPLSSIGGFLAQAWIAWLQSLVDAIQAAAAVVGSLSITGRSSAVVATPLNTNGLTDGFYKVTFYLRISRPASVSSSAQIVIGWTDGGVALSTTGTLLNGNTTATLQSGIVTIKVDQGTDVTVGVNYASVGGTSMQFAIEARLERVP